MPIIRLDPAFSVSPQLRPDDLPQVKAAGYVAIVNNRPDGEEPGQPTSAALAQAARRLGLGYTYLPIRPGSVIDAQARALGDLVAGTGGPVLAFCRSGARSTRLWERSRELGGPGAASRT